MIDSSEIRKGNWLRYGSGLIEDMLLVQVETIGKDGINHKTTFDHPDDIGGVEDVYGFTEKCEYENLHPIGLTADILEKARFNKSRHGYFEITSDLFSLAFDESGLDMALEGNHIATPFNHIKYLHQLQNLYFALTGTELEIKLL